MLRNLVNQRGTFEISFKFDEIFVSSQISTQQRIVHLKIDFNQISIPPIGFKQEFENLCYHLH